MDDTLKLFLYRAHLHGYGSANAHEEKQEDGERIIKFHDGDFEFKDVYYGGNPYAGQEVIFESGRAIWAMQYRGSVVEGEDYILTYAFLRETLVNTEIGLLRGEDGFSKNGFLYNIEMHGDLNDFNAKEIISRSGRIVYTANFLGGLVDIK